MTPPPGDRASAVPRLAEIFIRMVLRNAELTDGILGDLEEEMGRLVDSGRAPPRPALWYWKAVLGLSARFAFESVPGTRRLSTLSPMGIAKQRPPLMEVLKLDLTYALRGLKRSPGFTAVAILTLTVGIGANVAMFSVVEPTLLRPLPFDEPDRLVVGFGTREGSEYDQTVAAHNYADLRDRSTAFASLGAHSAWPWISSVTGGTEPLRLPVAWVSVDLFRTLRVDPVLGRHFAPDEGVPGGPNVAMISHALWEQSYGSDPDVLRRSLTIDGTPVSIVGVMPPRFRAWYECDIWMPLRLGEAFASDRRFQNFIMLGRLGPGVDLEQAQSQADVVGADLAEAFPFVNEGKGFRFTGLQESLTRSYRSSLFLLLGGVGLLLLIACGNLAALLLARGFSRNTEFSVRIALGASRGRILIQLLTESLLISLFGGVMGTLAALAAQRSIVGFLPFNLPAYASDVGISVPILGFALLLSVGTGFLIGLIPALRSARRNAAERLKAGSRTVDTHGTRIRGGLVVAQVALSMILLIASGLLVRTFVHLRGVDPGFDPEGLLAADLELPASAYPEAQSRVLFFTRLEERVRAIPGVMDVAMINRFPIRGLGGNTYVYPAGQAPADGQDVGTANERWVMPGYFEAMGIPILRGRGIETTDALGAPPVLVIDQTMAREFFPDTDPLGQSVIIDFDEGTPLEVVGIVGDVRSSGLAAEVFQTMYHSYLQEPVTRMEVGLRVAGEASMVAPALREAVRELDSNLPISRVDRMDQVIARTMGDQTVMAVILTAFAWVALGLAALGLYGVLAYFVSLRVPELGLRIALGAKQGHLLRMVAARGLGLFATGMVLGLAGALAATRFLQSLLVGVEPTDPATFIGVSVVIAVIGTAASILPARRAFKVDPTRALQAQ